MKNLHRRRIWRYLMLFLLSGIVLGGGMLVLMKKQEKEYEIEIDALESRLISYKKHVYVAGCDLPAGSTLTKEMVCLKERYSEGEEELYITEDDFGKTLLYDTVEGDCLYKYMFYSSAENVREVFFDDYDFKGELQAGDRVDIRIRYTDAEDYLVLSDKWIIACDEDGMLIRLTEEEILYLSSAISDKREYDGTSLYAVKYPAKESFCAMKMSYVPRKEILEILQQKSIKGEFRAALEARLKANEYE